MDFSPKLLDLPTIGSSQLGYISVAEFSENIPFEIKRAYWTYYTPHDVERGGHAHKKLEQMIFAVSGVIEMNTEDRQGNKEKFVLNKPHVGLYFPSLVWRNIRFSHNAVLLCLASRLFEEDDYLRDHDMFLMYCKLNYEKKILIAGAGGAPSEGVIKSLLKKRQKGNNYWNG